MSRIHIVIVTEQATIEFTNNVPEVEEIAAVMRLASAMAERQCHVESLRLKSTEKGTPK